MQPCFFIFAIMKHLLMIVSSLLLLETGYTQTRLSDHNTIAWMATTITPAISGKFSGHIEYQWRRSNFFENWQQGLFRIGVNVKLRDEVVLHGGYGWIITYPYGDYNLAPVSKAFPEHRLYQQLTITTKLASTSLSHRLRLEQRWVGRFASATSKAPDEFVFLNRLRYMPRLDISLKQDWYITLFDEIFIGFGKNVGENVFDQNRLSLLVGKRLNKNIRIEAGYLNQVVQLGREVDNKNVFQYNNGLLCATYFNL